MKYNLSRIMSRAWELHWKQGITFPEALHRAWESAKAKPTNAATIAQAKATAGITEEVNTWAGWKKLGYEVRHGSKALFGCDLIHAAGETARPTRPGFSVCLRSSPPRHKKSPLHHRRPKHDAKSLYPVNTEGTRLLYRLAPSKVK